MTAPTPFAKKLARIADDLHTRFHMQNEAEPALAKQIRKFWEEIGLAFPGVSTPWSAVFVSSCVKQAGATKAEFTFAAAHAQFAFQAIHNETKQSGVFRGRELASHAPGVGDIIQNNRGGNGFDYAFAKTHKSYLSHSAIVIETGTDTAGRYALTIGGNESDSIRRTVVRLTPQGLIKQRPANPYICVIANLK